MYTLESVQVIQLNRYNESVIEREYTRVHIQILHVHHAGTYITEY